MDRNALTDIIRDSLGISDPRDVGPIAKVNTPFIIKTHAKNKPENRYEVVLRCFDLDEGTRPELSICFVETHTRAYEIAERAVYDFVRITGKPLGCLWGEGSNGTDKHKRNKT